MGAFSLSHLLLLAIILIFVFRPRKFTDLTQAFGKAIRNYKDAKNEIEIESKDIKEIK